MIDPIAAAWRAVNPNTPFPQILWKTETNPEIEQRAEDARAERKRAALTDPKRAEAARAYQREWKRRRSAKLREQAAQAAAT
jgi:hypothetical protein